AAQPQLDRRVVEGAHRLAQLQEERALTVHLAAVRVEAAEVAEENLPLHVDAGGGVVARLDDAGDLEQLAAERRVREGGRDGRVDGLQGRARLQRARTDVGRRLDELHAGVERAEGVEGGAARGRLRRGEAGRVAVGEDVGERGVRVGDGERARVEARDEEADAGDGDDLREGGRAVEAAGLVGDATAP